MFHYTITTNRIFRKQVTLDNKGPEHIGLFGASRFFFYYLE